MAATTWRPAFSISTSDGMPISSIVRRSASRIWVEFNTRIPATLYVTYPAGPLVKSRHIRNRNACAHAPSPPRPRLRASRRRRYPCLMAAIVNVNGRIADQEHATIPVFDHGFLYGEGVYETLRTYHGQPFLFDRHMRRLRNSARMIALPVLFTDDEMERQIRETMAAAHLSGEAYIRVLVTRGVGDLTYDLKATPTPSVVIIVKAQTDPPAQAYDQGVRVVIVDIVRNHP